MQDAGLLEKSRLIAVSNLQPTCNKLQVGCKLTSKFQTVLLASGENLHYGAGDFSQFQSKHNSHSILHVRYTWTVNGSGKGATWRIMNLTTIQMKCASQKPSKTCVPKRDAGFRNRQSGGTGAPYWYLSGKASADETERLQGSAPCQQRKKVRAYHPYGISFQVLFFFLQEKFLMKRFHFWCCSIMLLLFGLRSGRLFSEDRQIFFKSVSNLFSFFFKSRKALRSFLNSPFTNTSFAISHARSKLKKIFLHSRYRHSLTRSSSINLSRWSAARISLPLFVTPTTT